MSTNQCDIGLIGLAVMGENLVLNMESKGFSVAVFNRTTEVTEKFVAERGKEKNITPTRTMEEFVGALKRPRIAMMMVKAGPPVDSVIGQLAPLLEKGRCHRSTAAIRSSPTRSGAATELESKGIHYVGMGVSGGEEGALKGPSLMPGGPRGVVGNHRADFPQDRRAGRWRTVLSLHGPGRRRSLRENGAQRYRVRRHAIDLRSLRDFERRPRNGAAQLADIFDEWNKGELNSYLIEITAKIFRKIDPETGKPLVDVILDKAGPKRNRALDAAISHRTVGRHLHHQRRGGRARDFVAQR